MYKQKIKDFLNLVKEVAGIVWNNWLPKEAKVAVYIAAAAILEKTATAISPDILNFIPDLYRVVIFNLLVVFLVEMAKRLRARQA